MDVPGGSDWTIDTLRAYQDAQIRHIEALLAAAAELNTQRFKGQEIAVLAALAAQEKAVAAALAAAERAVGKAELAAEKRFDSVNEFRAQLADLISTFMPRAETEQRLASNAEKIDSLAARVDTNDGRNGGLNAGWVILAGLVGVIAAVVAIVSAFAH